MSERPECPVCGRPVDYSYTIRDGETVDVSDGKSASSAIKCSPMLSSGLKYD